MQISAGKNVLLREYVTGKPKLLAEWWKRVVSNSLSKELSTELRPSA